MQRFVPTVSHCERNCFQTYSKKEPDSPLSDVLLLLHFRPTKEQATIIHEIRYEKP